MAHVNLSMNGRASDRSAQDLSHRRGSFSTSENRRLRVLPPPQPFRPPNPRDLRPGIPARLNREHAPYTIQPHPIPIGYRSAPHSSSQTEDVGYGVAFNIFPQPGEERTRNRTCPRPRHAHHHERLPAPYVLLGQDRAHGRVHAPAQPSAPQTPSSVQDYTRIQRELYDLGLPSPRQADPFLHRNFLGPASNARDHANIDNDDDWRYLNEIAEAQYSSPASVRRPASRYGDANTSQARVATPIPHWDGYEDYEEDEGGRDPFFELEYSPGGDSAVHALHLYDFAFSEGDYDDEDDSGSYDPDSVLDEDDLDSHSGSGSNTDGREYSSDPDDDENREEVDSEPEAVDAASQAEAHRSLADELRRQDGLVPHAAREDSVEAVDGDREQSEATASSSEMPAVRKRNAAGAAAQNGVEPASKRRRTATATPSRRTAAGRAAVLAKKEPKQEDGRFSLSDDEKEEDIIDISKSDELPPELLVEKPDNSVRLGKLQCVICMDDATNLMITHCGHLFCAECLHSSLHIDAVKRICPICRQKVELRESAGGRVGNPKRTYWPLELKLMTKTRAGKQAARR